MDFERDLYVIVALMAVLRDFDWSGSDANKLQPNPTFVPNHLCEIGELRLKLPKLQLTLQKSTVPQRPKRPQAAHHNYSAAQI